MIAAAAWFIYALLKKPEWVAVLLFTCIIADINFDMKGIPLNFRAFCTAVLFARVIVDKTVIPGPSFLATAYSKYVIVFVVYVLFVTFENHLLTPDIIKEYFWTVISAYLGYYFYMRTGSYRIFRLAIIIAGFSCLGDLAWTYVQGSGLIIQRLYFSFTPAYNVVNHNFFGYICAITFVFLIADYMTESGHNKYNLIMMPFMFLGVLLSTSRSALLMLILVAMALIIRGITSRKNSRKSVKLVMISVSCIVMAFSLFSIITTLFSIKSEFIETISARLIEEPLAIFNRAMGNAYKVDALDSMDWRAEASEIAYNTYMKILLPDEQIMGIGHNGFMARNYGYMGIYDAHNGILLSLIEFGLIGSLIYWSLLFSFFRRYWSQGLFSPFIICMIWLIMYITSHNRELTSIFVFLMMGTMEGQLQYEYIRDEIVHEEEMTMLATESLER
jgi:hypothetical protein